MTRATFLGFEAGNFSNGPGTQALNDSRGRRRSPKHFLSAYQHYRFLIGADRNQGV
jgi:hypothetical protein